MDHVVLPTLLRGPLRLNGPHKLLSACGRRPPAVTVVGYRISRGTPPPISWPLPGFTLHEYADDVMGVARTSETCQPKCILSGLAVVVELLYSDLDIRIYRHGMLVGEQVGNDIASGLQLAICILLVSSAASKESLSYAATFMREIAERCC